MEKNNNHIGLQIFIQIFIPIIMGVILLGPAVITPSNSFFVFSLYSFSAVIFCYLIENHGMRILLLLGTLLSIILVAIFKPTSDITALTRNILWYFLIGSSVISIYKTAKDKSRVFIIASWFVGFALVYTIMAIMNVYVFKFYKINHVISFSFYLQQGIKTGGIMGIGIGIGRVVSDFLFQNNIKASALKTKY